MNRVNYDVYLLYPFHCARVGTAPVFITNMRPQNLPVYTGVRTSWIIPFADLVTTKKKLYKGNQQKGWILLMYLEIGGKYYVLLVNCGKLNVFWKYF